MFQPICRKFNYDLSVVAITTTAGTPIPYGEYDSGVFIITGLTGATTMSFYGCAASTGTFKPICASDGALKTQAISADRAYAMPAEARGLPWVMLVTNATNVTFDFTRKS